MAGTNDRDPLCLGHAPPSPVVMRTRALSQMLALCSLTGGQFSVYTGIFASLADLTAGLTLGAGLATPAEDSEPC